MGRLEEGTILAAPKPRPALGAAEATASLPESAAVYVLLFSILVVWLLVWRYTGDGDSVLHYLAARTVWTDPTTVLGAWSRPLHKALIIFPALGGIIPARLTQAMLTIALAQQTVSLARQLRLRNALLAAPLLVFQPFVFALASDTMTEIPFALALVVALRLWMSGRLAWSCLMASFLPLLRPEGFFLIGMWGILLLLPRLPRNLSRAARREAANLPPRSTSIVFQRIVPIALLTVGMLLWIGACWIIAHDPFYFITIWSWPLESYDAYRAGPIYHYLVRWPVYCGLALTVPFMAGVRPSLGRRAMRLSSIIWLLVITLHSLFFWLHKCASVGLLRILVCTSPITALICLEGCNAIGDWLALRGISQAARRTIAIAVMAFAMLYAMAQYALLGKHYHCFAYQRLARAADARHFLDEYLARQWSPAPSAPRLIAGDKMFLATLGLIADPPHYTASTDGPMQANRMAMQPIGTIGAWDSEQAPAWHTLSIDDLPKLGYTIVYEYDQTVPDILGCIRRRSLFSRQRFVLIRKDKSK